MGLPWIFVRAIVARSAILAILVQWAASDVSAQVTGFLSLSCGGTNTFTDKNGIVWVPDTPYIFTGSSFQLPASAQQEEPLKSLRYFSGSRKKNCYVLPVTPNDTYLLRVTFLYANYDKLGKPPSFDLQYNGDFLLTVSIANPNSSERYELVLAPPAATISLCLAKSTPTDNPFISSLELRQLSPTMYPSVQENKLLGLYWRTNFGSISTYDIRFPLDPFDRIWYSDIPQSNVNSFIPLSTNHSVAAGVSFNKPPSAVMMTARTTANSSLPLSYSFNLPTNTLDYYVCFSFAEIAILATTDARIFTIDLTNSINDSAFFNDLNVQQVAAAAFTTIEFCATYTSLQGPATFTFRPTSASTLGPIVNAAEIYLISDILTVGTENTDVMVLEAFKSSFNLTSWTGDPCLPAHYTWDWLDCSNSSPPRVTALRLSNMSLNGVIPLSLSQMTALTDIWLDNNNISGTIPDCSALTNLRTLDLQNNSLTGSIPQSFSELQQLQELFIQDNNLSGPVPTTLTSTPGLTFRFFGNPNLCLPGNTSCLYALSPSPIGSTVGKTKRSTTPVVVGVVIGVVALILIAALAVICVRRANAKTLKRQQTPLSQLSTASAGSISHKDPPKQTQLYTFEEIRIATQNFRKKIGEGGFGPVYFGRLADGQEVAVKMLSSTSNQGKKEFFNEVDLLSRVHHKNLVSLIGYCYESNKQILVYEYMPNGTLRDNLYGSMVSKKPLDWKTRLKIALNAAQGLEYLHTGCSPTIIHRDVKSNNILLNRNLMAKVADFGLSKLQPEEGATHISTMVKGTAGYLDPEYYNTNQLTEKSDIYSFGVVLLEIICGRPPIYPQISRPELNLVEWVWPLLQEGRIHDIVDHALGKNYNTEAVWKVVEIAMMSVELHGVNRPTMCEVVNDLKEAIHLEKEFVLPILDASAESPFLANQAQVFTRPHKGQLDLPSLNFSSHENLVVEGG